MSGEDGDDRGAATAVLTERGASDPPGTVWEPRAPASASEEVTERLERLARIGAFTVVGELGRGGMGVVYEARDREIRRNVAVKVVREGASPEVLRRFVAEARINGQLEHPNIVPVHALGVDPDGTLWFAMRKIAGRNLHQVLKSLRAGQETHWTRHRLLVAFVQIAHAIAHAHERGVIHRDIKPANVILGEHGEVFVVDWGVATAIGEVDEAVVGTPGFMSPEQLAGEPLDVRSDVWALGVVLYEILTLKSPFPGRSWRERARRMLTEAPVDPRVHDPSVDEELAEICLRALCRDREQRVGSASELARAVEQSLEGSKRRAEAVRLLERARAQWRRLLALEEQERDLASERVMLEATIPSWASLEEKRALLENRRLLAETAELRVDGFEAVLATCERALARDPANADVRTFLADVYWSRFVEAEAAGDRAATARFRARVEAYDDGRYGPRLRGTGALSLRTDPPGAEVWCRRFDVRQLQWRLEEPVRLGATPLEAVPVEMGSMVLTIRAPGREPVTCPVHVTRARHWDAGVVRLPRPGEIAPGFVFVPAGPFVRGGDPEPQSSRPREQIWLDDYAIAVFPVTMAEYLDFLNDVHPRDPEQAWARAPRLDAGLDRSGPGLLVRPGPDERYVLPERDDFGEWRPDFPVHSVSWHDAVAYAAWRSSREGRSYALPTEDEWEKAARGVDGRTYPWGDDFDASLCKMNASRSGLPLIEPVGAFPTDVSVYGVRDMAGSMRCWCADPSFDGDPQRRVVRGGSYATNARVSRSAVRYGSPAQHTLPYQGIRLVQRLG